MRLSIGLKKYNKHISGTKALRQSPRMRATEKALLLIGSKDYMVEERLTGHRQDKSTHYYNKKFAVTLFNMITNLKS